MSFDPRLSDIFVAVDCIPITPGVTVHPELRAFFAASDGTVTFTAANGTSRTITVRDGLIYPIYAKAITGGTVTTVYGLV